MHRGQPHPPTLPAIGPSAPPPTPSAACRVPDGPRPERAGRPPCARGGCSGHERWSIPELATFHRLQHLDASRDELAAERLRSNPSTRPPAPLHSELPECPGSTGVLRRGGERRRSRNDAQQHLPTPVSSPAVGLASAPPDSATRGGEKDQGFKMEFQFVDNYSVDNRLIRSKVMRDHRAKERQSKGTKSEADTRLPKPAVETQKRKREASMPTGPTSTQAQMQETAGRETLSREMASSDADTTVVPRLHKRHRTYDFPQNWTNTHDDDCEQIHRHPPSHTHPRAVISASILDPFNATFLALPELAGGDGSYDKLRIIAHLAVVMPSLMDEIVTGTRFDRLGWLYSSVALYDPDPVSTVMGYTGSHLAMCRGEKEPQFAIEQKVRSLALINARMADRATAMSAPNIAAVLHIVFHEIVRCDAENASLHLKAVRELVRLRGGMSSFANHPEIESMIIRVEIIRAYIALSTPRFPTWGPIRCLLPIAIPIIPPSHAYRPSSMLHAPSTLPLQPTASSFYLSDTLHLLHTLEDSLHLCNEYAHHPHAPLHGALTLLSSSARQSLSPFNASSSSSSSSSASSPWKASIGRKSVRLAALAVLDVAVHEFFSPPTSPASLPSQRPFLRAFTRRFLGGRLGEETRRAKWGRAMEMVLSTLLEADRVRMERPWRGFYFAEALLLTKALCDGEWRRVEADLRLWFNAGGSASDDDGTGRAVNVWDLAAEVEWFEEEWTRWEEEVGKSPHSDQDIVS